MSNVSKKSGKIFVLSGPSGSGKTSLYNQLLSSNKLKGKIVKSVSVTTRSPRKGERNGRDYLFVSKKMFLYKIHAGHFVEWQKVVGNYYGTPKIHVREILESGKSVLLCIDVKGAKVVFDRYPDAISIFVQAPTLAELRKRLATRATESQQALKMRLKTAREEMKEARHYKYVIINDRLESAFKEMEGIICECLDH